MLPNSDNSIETTAKLLGISVGTLYNHIPDFKELRGPCPDRPKGLALTVPASRKQSATNRMEPLGQVARELWLLSGNECTFTGCDERLICEDGSFIGEVAHIHGVEPGSARHDPVLARDREALRAADNLMLLCPNHHTRIDHVKSRDKYPAPALRRMKKKHEDRFRQATAHIEAQFTDHTRATTVRYATTLHAFDAMFAHPRAGELTPEEKAEGVALVNGIADKLAGLTPQARSLLSYLVVADDVLGIAEVSRRTRQSQTEIRRTMEELHRLGFAYEETEPDWDEPRGALKLLIDKPFDGWPFWTDLRGFCEGDPDRIERVIAGLDFTLLD